MRWQELDPERQICLKVNSDDPTMDYPPFAGLLERLVSLMDLQGIQDIKDELSCYKLLVARLQPLKGTDIPDDFEVDIKTALKYYDKLSQSLPPFIASCISPLPIDVINFDKTNTTEDEDMISNSLRNIFRSIGGVILDNEKTGTTIYEAQIIADMEYAQATLVPQINKWLNLYFNYVIGEDHAIIKYISGVSPYTRKAVRKSFLESAQNGMPTKLEICILDGKTPLEAISQLHLEKALGLQEMLVPLSTSYTKSGDTDPVSGGRPVEDDSTQLTDEGSRSREK